MRVKFDSFSRYPEQNDSDEIGHWQERLSALADNTIQFDGELHSVTYLRIMVSLHSILEGVLTRIYSIRRRRSYTEEHDINTMQDINTQLEGWYDKLPEYTKWRPGSPSVLPHFFVMHLWHAQVSFSLGVQLVSPANLSSSIIKILLHRTFIPLRHSSWAICTRSADDIYAIMENYDEAFSLRAIASTGT